jgi:hypothetical protein
MHSAELHQQLTAACQKLVQAVSDKNFNGLPLLLEEQRKLVFSNLAELDNVAKQQVQNTLSHCLLAVTLSRAHCLNAIEINQRKLGVLSAYQIN